MTIWWLREGAARLTEGGGKNARIVQKLRLHPWRQYHVSVRVKTQDFHGQPEIKVLPEKSEPRSSGRTSA